MRKQSLNSIGHADDVRSRLPLNIHDDRRGGVHPRGLLHVFRAVNGCGDVRQPHRRAIPIGDNNLVVLLARRELIVSANRECLPWPVQHAFCLIYVGCCQRGADVFQTQIV